MKIQLIGEPKIIVQNKDSNHNYFAWPTVEKLPDGRIAVVCSGFRLEHICPFGKACISYSNDNGETYTKPMPIIDTPLDDRDAGILAYGNNVIVTSFNNTRHFQKDYNKNNPYVQSYIDTVTDEQEKKYLGAQYVISNDGGNTFGDVKISPVTSPHGPAKLKDGKILWVGWRFEGYYQGNELMCYEILPNGTMEYVGTIPEIENLRECEPHMIEAPDGTLICHIRTEDNFTIFQSESYDKGKTWTKPHRILEDNGGAPAHLTVHSSGMLISSYGYREKPYGCKVMFSKDMGKTWDAGYWLYKNGISSDLGYPATIELDDGTMLTVFYARPEKDMPAVIMQQKWRFSEE